MSFTHKLASFWRLLFGNNIHAFGSVSVLLLLSLAIAPAKNFFSEWRHYQKQYVHMIQQRSDAVALQRHFKPGIQQIWLPSLGVVDRCTTCHIGLQEASLSDIKTGPFRKHPPVYHAIEQFGCVICHEGQGPATTLNEAHHSSEAWEQPILKPVHLQAGCGQCHFDKLLGTPQLNLGRDMLAHFGCVNCHTLYQPDGSSFTATDRPPTLTHIAEKTTREWIFAFVKNPQAYSTRSGMPNFGFKDDDLRDISAFLVTQSTPSGAVFTTTKTIGQPTAEPTAGASLYGQSFCTTCHAVQNAAGMIVGGDIGPELTKVGTKTKPEWLKAWLQQPSSYDPQTQMPHYRFSNEQLTLLSGFLAAKTDTDFLANVHLDQPASEQVSHGKKLVVEYGCASCHEINGVKKPENFAPDLTRMGSRSVAQLTFLPGMPHTIADYIEVKVRSPRSFGPGLKMPQFTFSAQQIDAITTALMAQNERAESLPANLHVYSKRQSHYEPAGQAGQLISDLRCLSCHVINGKGSDLAPDLSWEGSSVQRPWLEKFLKDPTTLRPALIRRMPKFNLSDQEIKILSDYIMTVYQHPEIEREKTFPADSHTLEIGKQLFNSKYACTSCHIVDTARDKGYIGPVLSDTGGRLTPAWIYKWLKAPQSLRTETLEPNQNISDEDARALTAYLASLHVRSIKEAGK